MANHSSVQLAVEDIRVQYLQYLDRIRDMIVNLFAELSDRGKDRMIQILESAVTPTGLERAARGGIAGRVEKGTMRDAIESNHPEFEGDEIVAEWGWLHEVQRYFLLQEEGPDGPHNFNVRFNGMKALHGSYVEMREELLGRLKGLL